MSEELAAIPDTRMMEARGQTLFQKISDLKVKDDESYKLAGDLLLETKKIVNGIEEAFEGPVKQAYQAHKSINDLKKKVISQFLEAEELAKNKMEAFDGPKVEGIIKAELWYGELVDERLIPREYLTPDLKKLAAVTKALRGETLIPGWKVSCQKNISVRA